MESQHPGLQTRNVQCIFQRFWLKSRFFFRGLKLVICIKWDRKSLTLTFGYLEFLGQPSIATIILCPTRLAACLVSIRIRGIRRSAGVKRCLVACQIQKLINAMHQTHISRNIRFLKWLNSHAIECMTKIQWLH